MLRIYDEFLEDETILALRDRAYRLHVSALVYCSRNLTDGALTKKAVKVLQLLLEYPVGRHVTELVAAGLWVPSDDGWTIRNYLDFNPSADVIKRERRQSRDRMRKLREKRAGHTEPHTERSPEHAPEGDGAVPFPPKPLELKELQALPRPHTTQGHEQQLWRRLCTAANARTPTAIQKLERTIRAHKSTPRDIHCAIDAATGPGVRDPLAVALTELVKRGKEHAA